MAMMDENGILDDLECPHCGGMDFEQGSLFSKSETGFMSDNDDSWIAFSDTIEAFACTKCGRIELFTQVVEDD